MELNNITNTGTWGEQATRLNDNFNKVALGIDTLQSAYQSLSQSAIEAVDTLPQTGEANKIYRLVGTTSYSDYMYNTDDLTTPILMATYNNAIDNTPTANSANLVTSGGVAEALALGAVYDVSANNPTAGSNNDGKWESISALLSDANLNTLIPISVRKGGMSVKFVQSSDNKYVQYRLMSDSFNTTPTNWQGVDDVPTAGSNNLIKSGATYLTTYTNGTFGEGNRYLKLYTGKPVLFINNSDIYCYIYTRYSWNGENIQSVRVYAHTYVLFTPEHDTNVIRADKAGQQGTLTISFEKDETVIQNYIDNFSQNTSLINLNTEKASVRTFRKNLFNKNAEGNKIGYYLSTEGGEYPNSNYMITDYIPFPQEYGKLICSILGSVIAGGGAIVLYDKFKRVIIGEQAGILGGVATWQEGTCYVRFSIQYYGDLNSIMIEVGDVAHSYIPFDKDILNDESAPQINMKYSGDDTTLPFSINAGDHVLFVNTGTIYFYIYTRKTWNTNCKTIRVEANSYTEFIADEDTNYIRLNRAGQTQSASFYCTKNISEIEAIKKLYGIRQKQLDSILGQNYTFVTEDSFSANSTISLANYPYYNKYGDCINFYAEFLSFDEILIGKGYNSFRGRWIKIDDTNITMYNYPNDGAEVVTTVAHGLSMATYIKCCMQINNNGYLSVVLQTLNGMFYHDFEFDCYDSSGSIFATSSTALSNAKLSANNFNFKKPIWVFGDSYVSISTERWTGVLKGLGYNDFFLNGYPGINSAISYNDFLRCISFGTPKYLLWLLGMNDPTTDSFTSILYKVKSFCDTNNVELIVGIVPTVPERDKDGIKTYILNSGIRYVDFYKAVGTNANGEWYKGYLSSDNIHPTALGAQALATQVILDFPEIITNK